jgi:hypothetical protein
VAIIPFWIISDLVGRSGLPSCFPRKKAGAEADWEGKTKT